MFFAKSLKTKFKFSCKLLKLNLIVSTSITKLEYPICAERNLFLISSLRFLFSHENMLFDLFQVTNKPLLLNLNLN